MKSYRLTVMDRIVNLILGIVGICTGLLAAENIVNADVCGQVDHGYYVNAPVPCPGGQCLDLGFFPAGDACGSTLPKCDTGSTDWFRSVPTTQWYSCAYASNSTYPACTMSCFVCANTYPLQGASCTVAAKCSQLSGQILNCVATQAVSR